MALHVDYEVRWKNYRAFEDTDWVTIRPLTILIGRNNAGKTSLVSPMLLMSQTMSSRDAQTALVARGPLVDAGTFKGMIHGHDTTKSLSLGFRFHVHDDDPKKKMKRIGSYPPGAIEVTLASGNSVGDIIVEKFEISDIYRRPVFSHTRLPDGNYSLDGFDQGEMKSDEKKAISASRPVNFLFSPAAAIRAYREAQPKAADEEAPSIKFSTGFSNYLNNIAFQYEELRTIFRNIAYIGPLRERPRRYYEIAAFTPASVGSRGQNMANVIQRRHMDIGPQLNSWVQRFEFGEKLAVQKLSDELLVLSFEAGKPRLLTNIADAGFGASQVLPLIVGATQSCAIKRRPLATRLAG
jgi:hypothetical protein